MPYSDDGYGGGVRSGPTSHRVFDVLASLNVSLESDIAYRPGPHSSTPAFLFGDSSGRGGGAAVSGSEELAALLLHASRDFGLLFSLKQRPGNAGTILLIADGDGEDNR